MQGENEMWMWDMKSDTVVRVYLLAKLKAWIILNFPLVLYLYSDHWEKSHNLADRYTSGL